MGQVCEMNFITEYYALLDYDVFPKESDHQWDSKG